MDVDRRIAAAGLGLAGLAGLVALRTPPVDAAPPRVRPGLYDCDGCQAVAERAPARMAAVVRLAGPREPGEPMVLSGRVTDPLTGRPRADVVIYAHHTNAAGLYADGTPETEWSRRHGRLRGWARTDAEGRYRFDTIKPAPYPRDTIPAHVHLFVGEPGRRPYYIDDVVFDGEFGVDAAYRARQELRGGSGIVRLRREGGVWQARRDIVLERHA